MGNINSLVGLNVTITSKSFPPGSNNDILSLIADANPLDHYMGLRKGLHNSRRGRIQFIHHFDLGEVFNEQRGNPLSARAMEAFYFKAIGHHVLQQFLDLSPAFYQPVGQKLAGRFSRLMKRKRLYPRRAYSGPDLPASLVGP